MLRLLFCICMPQMHETLLLIASTSSQTSRCHARDHKQQSKLQFLQGHELCSNVAQTEKGCLMADVSDASDSESEFSDSSDDVVVCDHKPEDWIDRPQGNSRKRQRDDEDDAAGYEEEETRGIEAGELEESHPGGEI
ncbi:hypothetical protein BDR05DRAFT_1006263 [Suillus weaverae]|nr:hypothetical protein BDR05DRAFT_1006263 [Suillus weaverae]